MAARDGGELRAAGGCCGDGPAERWARLPGQSRAAGEYFPALVTEATETGGVQPRERDTGRFPCWRRGALPRSRPKAPGLGPKARGSAAAPASRSRAVRGAPGPPAGGARAAQASGWRRRHSSFQFSLRPLVTV